MPRKYIKQQNSTNFVYPNNVIAQYDQELIHDLNNNNLSGVTFTINSITGTTNQLDVNFNYTIFTNGAEQFIRNYGSGNVASIFSVHVMTPNRSYFKPWRLVYGNQNITGATAYTGATSTFSFSSEACGLGLSGFTNGVYTFEFRAIAKRSVVPICRTFNVTGITPNPTPTPTPSPTATPVQPTPTPTPTSGPSIYNSGVTINVTDTGYIKFDTATGTTYFNCTSLGTQVLPGCLVCSSVREGIPFANLGAFTVTNCGNPCGGSPSPTPTPTATSPGGCTPSMYVITTSGYFQYTSCSNEPLSGYFVVGQIICICRGTSVTSYDGGTGYDSGDNCECI